MMSKKSKVIVGSLMGIAFAGFFVTLSTFAVFSDTSNISNHIIAENIDVTLKRTNLEYTYYNDGSVSTKTDDTIYSFSGDEHNDDSIFADIKEDEHDVQYFAPSLYRTATMELSTESNVAYTYTLGFKFTEGFEQSEDLGKQIKVTVTPKDLTSTSFTLNELTSEKKIEGQDGAGLTIFKASGSTTFDVKIEFLNDADPNSGLEVGDNNKAEGKEVKFDMTVYAVQSLA